VSSAEVYIASTRHYDGLPDLGYPFHDRNVLVTAGDRVCLHRKRANISAVPAGQKLGIKEVDVLAEGENSVRTLPEFDPRLFEGSCRPAPHRQKNISSRSSA